MNWGVRMYSSQVSASTFSIPPRILRISSEGGETGEKLRPDAGHVREGVRPELLESGDLVEAFVHVIAHSGIFTKLLLFVSANRMLGSPTNQKKLIGPNKNR